MGQQSVVLETMHVFAEGGAHCFHDDPRSRGIPSKEDPPRTQKDKSHRFRAHVLEVRHRHRQQSIAEICSRVLETPM